MAVLVIGLLVSAVAAFHVRDDIRHDTSQRLALSANQLTDLIRARLESYELLLRGGTSLFLASDSVSRQDWRTYYVNSQAERMVPGFQSFGFVQLIPPTQLAAHTAAVRAQGFPNYAIKPAGTRDIYTAIVYVEPFGGRNLRALGLDMLAEPERRMAMERARDTGLATMTGKITLIQEDDVDIQSGAMMLVPVYRRGAVLNTVEDKRAALIGWIGCTFRMGDLMSEILKNWRAEQGRYIRLRLYDGGSPAAEKLMFDSFPQKATQPAPFIQRRSLDFNGRQWLLEYERTSAGPLVSYAAVWWTFFGGLGISVLLAAWVGSLLQTRERAVELADKFLDRSKESEHQLKLSEFRWRFAVEGAGDGLWDWDVASGTVFFSRHWKEMLGYRDDEIGTSLAEWEGRIHPEDKADTIAAVRDYLAGKAPFYASEHRVRCKDGTYKWILDRGMIVSRGEDGKPERLIGTHTDITQNKKLETSLRESQQELLEAQRIARVGSWSIDLLSQKVQWSAELRKMYGLAPGVPVPDFTQYAQLFTPQSWARISEAVAQARRNGGSHDLEVEAVSLAGQTGWLRLKGEAIPNDRGEIVALHGTCQDITEQKRAQLRIEQLGRLYSVLSECNSAIVHCTTSEELFARICSAVVDRGGMLMAWVGLVDAQTQRVVPQQRAGTGTSYLDDIVVTIDADDLHGRGPTGTSIRENRPVWLDDFAHNPMAAPWRERGARYGWAASAALPIRLTSQPIGALTFYAGQSGWFDPEARKLLEEIGDSISFAVDTIDARKKAAEYQATLVESENRFRSLVEQSIAGAFIVQEDRIVYANARAGHILGFANPQDLIGRPVLDLIFTQNKDEVSARIRQLAAGETEKAEFLFTTSHLDGKQVEVGVSIAAASYQGRPALIGMMQDISDRKVAEDQIRRYAELMEHTFFQTVGLANTLSELRDPYTSGHERRVAEIAMAIGRRMGLSENRIIGLRVGGYLHDVGQMAIPAEILIKPTRLNDLEFTLVKEHTNHGYTILKEVDFPWPVAEMARQHHERIDGSGYPLGLKGDEILLESRIIAVADVVESMSSHRPFRPALGLERALEEIEHGCGIVYDAEVATACLKVFREDGFVIPDGAGRSAD